MTEHMDNMLRKDPKENSEWPVVLSLEVAGVVQAIGCGWDRAGDQK